MAVVQVVEGWICTLDGRIRDSKEAADADERREQLAIENAKASKVGDRYSNLDTETLRVRAVKQIAEESKVQYEAGINDFVLKFMATSPWYVPCQANLVRISDHLSRLLESTGKDWSSVTTHDIKRAIDATFDDGELNYRGEYHRLTPSDAELAAMSLDELENLERDARNS